MPQIHYTRFPVDGEVANLLRTCYGETGVMDFGLNGTHFSCLTTLQHSANLVAESQNLDQQQRTSR